MADRTTTRTFEEHKVISYDGQVNDYNRYYRRDMICTVKNLSDGSKLTLRDYNQIITEEKAKKLVEAASTRRHHTPKPNPRRG